MKKINSLILSIVCLCSFAHAETDTRVEALKREVIHTLPAILGWCTPEKALNFIDLVLETKPKLCVEIGVFGGQSLFPVASALKFLNEGIIIGIDPWDKIECIKYFDPIKDKADLQWWGKQNLNWIQHTCETMIKNYELTPYSKIIKSTSEKAAAQIKDPIDILYIDGNHYETVSTNDVLLYLPKVRPGGYIWMNDTLWSQTQSAIDLLMESCDVVKLIDNGNCILFKKR